MRIGIFGGTFDPIHNAHICCAIKVMEQLALDRVIFIPAGDPPHKISRRVTPAKDRLAMVSSAIQGYANFYVSDIECRRDGLTYTFDTLRELRAEYKDSDTLYMIIGADTLRDIVNWYRSEDVFKMCIFAAMKRPGSSDGEFYEAFHIASSAGAKVVPADAPLMDISSTDIRKAAAKGEDISAFVPENVREYIEKNEIYKPRSMDFTEIYNDVSMLMSRKRFEHSVGVMHECERLAQIFGADIDKCRLAGLLHDCGKELSAQQYRWLGIKYEGKADYDAKEVLLHARAGAILASERYGITDPDILEAIECHVTGRPEMGIAAQILFVADYTEPGRTGDMFDAVRKKIDEGSLELAMLEECDRVIKYNMDKKGARVCVEGVRTRNWILDKIAEGAEEGGKNGS